MNTGDNLVPKWAFLVLLIIFLLFGAAPAGGSNAPVCRFAEATVANRVKDLREGGTLEEKVARMYTCDEGNSVTRPVKELKGYQWVHLEPGQVGALLCSLSAPDLAFYNLAMNHVVAQSSLKTMTGTSSRKRDLQNTTLNVNQKTSLSAK